MSVQKIKSESKYLSTSAKLSFLMLAGWLALMGAMGGLAYIMF